MQHKKPHISEDCNSETRTRRKFGFGAAAQHALDNAKEQGKHNGAPHRFGSMYRSGLSLADLQPGECGYIFNLNASSRDRLRLLEMGLTPGTHVKVIRAAAFGGPLDILVRGYQLSLRRDEASAVWLDDPDKLG